MIDKRPRQLWFRSILLAAIVFGGAGCAEELGPAPMPVGRVKGVVTNGRLPVRDGWIEFIPVDGTVGNPFSAKIREDGSFDAARVPVGTNLVRVAHVSLGSAEAERLFGAYHSPIRCVVGSQPTEPVVIDLVGESFRFKLRSMAPKSQTGNAGDAR